ncbi:putative ATP binding protein [Spraguea lophii 42_110]|uniref:GPN-loop GTPase 2 n=1 Tax=Spraguea lophii (strain 42_110) TaxID=1358809 RepID=S7W7H8_SPRLO|nr:putative ATP binding protein [Spraguea lophii 42_110]
MLFGEIVVGPPGVGKSTYIAYKVKLLEKRKIFTINLDPGNTGEFDYDIKKYCHGTTTNEENKNDKSKKFYSSTPNKAIKKLLSELSTSKEIFDDNENYFLIDIPGQLESVISYPYIEEFITYLKKQNIHLVVISLIDSSIFCNTHNLITSLLFQSILMINLDAPFIIVISKCDNIKNYNINLDITKEKIKHSTYTLNRMAENEYITFDDNKLLTYLNNLKYTTDNKFLLTALEYIENEALVGIELLDYENKDTVMYLQCLIDKIHGDDFYLKDLEEVPDKEKIYEYYFK